MDEQFKNAKEFSKKYYQLDKTNIRNVSLNSAIKFAERYHKEAGNIVLINKSFSNKKDLLNFIYRNIPIAIKPKSKSAKNTLVNPFTSNNSFDQVCKGLAEKLFKRLL